MSRKLFEEEHLIFRDSFRKFLEHEVIPCMAKWEEDGIVPVEVWKKMGENGFLCPWMEEKYGGVGAGFEYSVIINEEIFRAGATGLAVGLHSDVTVPYIHSFGTEEQRMRWLPGCASGDVITCIAMTEPNAGSDLAAIRTRAVRDGDEYVINGQKIFISGGINSNLAVVAVKTDPKAVPPTEGISLVCVEYGTPGFSKGRKHKKMGLHSQDTPELFFEDCRIPGSNLFHLCSWAGVPLPAACFVCFL